MEVFGREKTEWESKYALLLDWLAYLPNLILVVSRCWNTSWLSPTSWVCGTETRYSFWMWFPASQPPEGLTSWRLPVMKREKRNKPSGCFMSPHLKSSQVDFPSQIKWEIFWVKKHQLCTLERLFVYKTWWKDTFDWVIKEIWFIPELYFCLSCALWHLMR